VLSLSTEQVERESGVAQESDLEHVCVSCGVRVNLEDVESTNGWRWFSDGAGGLFPLCETCPVPTGLAGA